jgi:transposase-like protein
VIFIDAIHVKVRDGQATNRPSHVVIGVTGDGHRDILGIWAGDGAEGAKYWLQVLTEIKTAASTTCACPAPQAVVDALAAGAGGCLGAGT